MRRPLEEYSRQGVSRKGFLEIKKQVYLVQKIESIVIHIYKT